MRVATSPVSREASAQGTAGRTGKAAGLGVAEGVGAAGGGEVEVEVGVHVGLPVRSVDGTVSIVLLARGPHIGRTEAILAPDPLAA